MKEVQLTEHFRLSEFTFSATANYRIEPDQGQIEMHRILAETVEQLLREPTKIRMRARSGQRDRNIYLALLSAGYNPSSRSDHFFGSEINGWRYTVGAHDYEFLDHQDETSRIYTETVARLEANYHLNRRVGQLIYYPERKIIHISNSWKMIYSPEMCDFLNKFRGNRKRFLIYVRGGYIVYEKNMKIN